MNLVTDLSVEEFNKKAMTWHLFAQCIGWGNFAEAYSHSFHRRKRIGKKMALRAIKNFVLRDELKLHRGRD
jgi:hypothetical protein